MTQIANDTRGITRGHDILKKKIALPVIFVLTKPGTEARSKSESMNSPETAAEAKVIRELLFNTGAIHYAVTVMDIYEQKAVEILADLEKEGMNADRLKLYLDL